jgi:hypothetical protein
MVEPDKGMDRILDENVFAFDFPRLDGLQVVIRLRDG